MLGRFRDYSGSIYANPNIAIHVADGRNFVRRSNARYDVIQASLVDTWAATAAGAYTLTENSLYTTEAFGEYMDHLSDNGVLTITRWVFDGLRLVSLAQQACEERGLDPSRHLAIVRYGRVATFLLKKQPFTPEDVRSLQDVSSRLGFTVLYAPGVAPEAVTDEPAEMTRSGTSAADYSRLILAPDRARFIAEYPLDIRPTTDDRPFFFHTTRLRDQFQVAFGRSMLFGNGLSALLTLFGISAALVLLFIVGPLILEGGRPGKGWAGWLAYFGTLGAGFMLIEIALLQHFVLLLGHPVYSLTVTLFSLLLGTGVGSLIGRRIPDDRVKAVTLRALAAVATTAVLAALLLPRLIDMAIPWPLPLRIVVAATVLVPIGILLGTPPSGRYATAVQTATRRDRVGLGHERRILGDRRDPCRLHRDELGLLGHAARRCPRVRNRGSNSSNAVKTVKTPVSNSMADFIETVRGCTFDDFLFTPQHSVLDRRDPARSTCRAGSRSTWR